MGESLKVIQTLAKIGKIASKIVFIVCIVCACVSLAALLSLAVGFTDSIEIGSVTIRGFFADNFGLSNDQLCISVVNTILVLAGEAVIAGFSAKYFDNELIDGTPFTFDGAKEMLRLGIITISVSMGTTIVAAIVTKIMEVAMGCERVASQFDVDFGDTLGIGLLFIFISFVFKYGAEVVADKTK